MTTARPRKLPSGNVVWRVQFRVNGRVTSESFASAGPAEKFAKLVDKVGGEAAQRTRDARDSNAQEAPTLIEWTRDYLNLSTGHLTGVTPGTRKSYAEIAERSFLQVLGELPLTAITKQEVAKWVTWQQAQPSHQRPGQAVSAKTIRNYHGVLSSVLGAAVDERLVEYNAAKGIRLVRGIRQGITFLTEDEFYLIRDFMPEYYRPLTTWLVWTGMRWGEATALTWGDIDRRRNPPSARITKAWQKGETKVPVLGPPKTPRSLRTIVVPPWVVEQLGPPGKSTDLIFVGMKEGNRLWWQRYYKAAWAPAVKKANDEAACAAVGAEPLGRRPRIHDLRHTHASWLIDEGLQPFQIQARMGHESITTTYDLYGHLMPDAMQQMSDVLVSRSRPRELSA